MNQTLTVEHIEAHRTALLEELTRRQGVARDYVRAVAHGYATGLYLFGRPGTAKTRTVRAVLGDDVRLPYVYQRGHLTPLGLFELLADHRDDVIVLDDLVTIFNSDVALQVLLSALEHPTGPDRSRVIEYRRKGAVERVAFTGGLICITNRELHDDDLLDAFRSRVNTLNYDPSDAQLGALMLDAAARGVGGVPPAAAVEVARYVIGETLRLGARLDLRLFFDKGLASYRLWKDDEAESDWRDLVTASIEEHLVAVRHADDRAAGSRAERKVREHELLRELLRDYPTRQDRVRAWVERTGKSERAFYRRLAEIR
jgi:hypothetical protein